MNWIVGWYVAAFLVCKFYHTSMPWFVWAWPLVGYIIGYTLSIIIHILMVYHGKKN